MNKHRISLILLAAFTLFNLMSVAQEDTTKKTMSKPKAETKKMGSSKSEIVIVKTSMGIIKIELNAEKAPITVKNFLSYVDEKYFDSTVFHRVIKGFMIQAGGFAAGDPIREKTTKAAIKNESSNGLKNDRGTLAMARTNEPNSATSQFFINTVNNDMLNQGVRDPNGYAVFGKVIEGMDVVDKIADLKTGNAMALARYSSNPVPFQDVPQEKVLIESIRRAKSKK